MHLLEVLEQDPALAVDDRLRQARRARAVEHPQRVVERRRARTPAMTLRRRGTRPPSPCRRGSRSARPARRSRRDPIDDLAAVEVLAAVAVAVDRQQHLRLDLREAVDDRARAELRRRARPDRAQRRGREERRDRLRDVRHVRRHAVALADAERDQPGADPRGLARAARPRSTRRARAAPTRGGSRPRRRPCRGRCARRSDSRAPGNHSAPGISRDASTAVVGASTPKKSQIAAQNPSRSSTDQRHSDVVVVRLHAALGSAASPRRACACARPTPLRSAGASQELRWRLGHGAARMLLRSASRSSSPRVSRRAASPRRWSRGPARCRA